MQNWLHWKLLHQEHKFPRLFKNILYCDRRLSACDFIRATLISVLVLRFIFFLLFFHLIINFFLCYAMFSILGIDLNRSPLNLALHRQWNHAKIENLQRGVTGGYKSYFLILNRYFQVPPNYLSLNNAKSTRVLDCGRQLVYSRPRSSPSRVRVGVEAWSSIRLQSKKYFITELRWKSEFICANFIKYRKRKSSTKPR